MPGTRQIASVGRPRPALPPHAQVAVAASLASLVLLVGCGQTVIDAKKAREAVGEDVERKTGVEVRSVSCPSDVEVFPGDTFTCRVVSADGRAADVELRIRNFEADVETVSISPAQS